MWLYEDSSCATRRGTVEGTVSLTTVTITSPSLGLGGSTFYAGVVDDAGNVGCYATGVTYTRALTAALTGVNPSSITEHNLNGATVDVTLSGTQYVSDANLQTSQFTLNGITGLTVNSYERRSNTVVRLTLAYTAADFDSDETLTVTVAAAAHTDTGTITTDQLTVPAIVEPAAPTGLALETDSGISATDKLTNDASSFTFTVPAAQRANIVSGGTATVFAYTTNAGGTCDAPTGGNSGWVPHASENDHSGYNSGVWTVDGGSNRPDGSHCYTAAYDPDGSGATHPLSHYSAAIKVETDDTNPTAPTNIGLSATTGSATTVDATVTASTGSRVWLYEDSSCATRRGTVEGTVVSTSVTITSPSLGVGANTIYGGVVDDAGNVGCYATGATYTRVATATLTANTPPSLSENNLNGATVNVTLTGTTFNTFLNRRNFTVNIPGLEVGSAVRQTNPATAVVTLEYNGADFDADTNLAITVAASEHTGPAAVTTGDLAVSAVNDPPKATGLALSTDSGSSATDGITNDSSSFMMTIPNAQRVTVASGSTAKVYRYNTTGGSCAAPTGSNGGWQTHATETDNSGYNSGIWVIDGGTNPADGTHCYTAVYDLDGASATYVESHYADPVRVQTDDTVPPTPTAVTSTDGTSGGRSTITVRVTATEGTVRLYSNSSCTTRHGTNEATISGGTADVESGALTLGSNTLYAGVTDRAGNSSCLATGVSYNQLASAALTAVTALNENALNGATLDVTLTGATFNAALTPANFTITGLAGLTVSAVARQTNNAVARLTLAYGGGDFDTDADITVTIPASEYTGNAVITSGTITVTAIDEDARRRRGGGGGGGPIPSSYDGGAPSLGSPTVPTSPVVRSLSGGSSADRIAQLRDRINRVRQALTTLRQQGRTTTTTTTTTAGASTDLVRITALRQRIEQVRRALEALRDRRASGSTGTTDTGSGSGGTTGSSSTTTGTTGSSGSGSSGSGTTDTGTGTGSSGTTGTGSTGSGSGTGSSGSTTTGTTDTGTTTTPALRTSVSTGSLSRTIDDQARRIEEIRSRIQRIRANLDALRSRQSGGSAAPAGESTEAALGNVWDRLDSIQERLNAQQ